MDELSGRTFRDYLRKMEAETLQAKARILEAGALLTALAIDPSITSLREPAATLPTRDEPPPC